MPRILSNDHLHHGRRRRSSIGSNTMGMSSNTCTMSVSMNESSTRRMPQTEVADWSSFFTGYPVMSANKADASSKSSKAPTAPPSSSSSSSGRSTPNLDDMDDSDRVDDSRLYQARREILPRRASTGTGASSPPKRGRFTVSTEAEDGWGQFVDTEEAEKELIRHSRILSKKEIPRMVPINDSTDFDGWNSVWF